MRISDWSSDVCSSDLAGFASALVLAVVAIGIGVESVVRLFQPTTVAFTEATSVAAIGLAVNIVSAFLLAGDRKSVVKGKSVTLGVDLSGRSIITKPHTN